jgi:hypothetical protein
MSQEVFNSHLWGCIIVCIISTISADRGVVSAGVRVRQIADLKVQLLL